MKALMGVTGSLPGGSVLGNSGFISGPTSGSVTGSRSGGVGLSFRGL